MNFKKEKANEVYRSDGNLLLNMYRFNSQIFNMYLSCIIYIMLNRKIQNPPLYLILNIGLLPYYNDKKIHYPYSPCFSS